jgi:hypothetical protein
VPSSDVLGIEIGTSIGAPIGFSPPPAPASRSALTARRLRSVAGSTSPVPGRTAPAPAPPRASFLPRPFFWLMVACSRWKSLSG